MYKEYPRNFYGECLYLLFCLSFVYSVMLITALFCLPDPMLHLYMCLVLFGLWCLMPLLTLFHLVVSFIGGGKKHKKNS